MLRRFLLVLAVAAVAGSASAQDFFHRPSALAGRSLLTLSLFDEVRAELKTTADQNKKEDDLIEKLQMDIMEAVQGGGGDPASIRGAIEKATIKGDEELVKVLNADQTKRLNELLVQYNNGGVLSRSDVQKNLSFTDDQKASIKKLLDDQFQKTMEAFQGGGGDPNETINKIYADFATSAEKLLTDDQKKKFKDMAGTKFEFKKATS